MAIPVLPDDSLRVRDRYHRIRRVVTVLVCVGLLVQGGGNRLFEEQARGSWRAWGLAFAAGMIFHLAACILFARVKGRSSWFGLVGVFGVFGVLWLFLMDSQCHRCGRREGKSCRECPNCGAPM